MHRAEPKITTPHCKKNMLRYSIKLVASQKFPKIFFLLFSFGHFFYTYISLLVGTVIDFHVTIKYCLFSYNSLKYYELPLVWISKLGHFSSTLTDALAII